MKRLILAGMSLALCGGIAATAGATPVTVNSADNIYGAGQVSAPGGGNLPVSVAVVGGQAITFSSVTGSTGCGVSTEGCISMNGGSTSNDADGNGAAVSSSSNTGSGSLSGIIGPGAGYLVGVFVAAGGPSGSAPSSLDFTGVGATAFTSLSPALDQVFFIGDGLSSDGTGLAQQFIAPSGAATLYLGISDACSYNGSPGCYGDNIGSYSLTVSAAAIPEPFSLNLLGTAFAGLGLLRLRKRD